MDPLLRELRDKIQSSGVGLILSGTAGGMCFMGMICSPRHLAKDFEDFLESEIGKLEPDDSEAPTPERIRALNFEHSDSEPDPRYITLSGVTISRSAGDAFDVDYLRLDLESLDSWWLRPGAEDDEDDSDSARFAS